MNVLEFGFLGLIICVLYDTYVTGMPPLRNHAVLVKEKFVSCLHKGPQEWGLPISEIFRYSWLHCPLYPENGQILLWAYFVECVIKVLSYNHKSLFPPKQLRSYSVNAGRSCGFRSLWKALGTGSVPCCCFSSPFSLPFTFIAFLHYPILFFNKKECM